MYNYIYLTPPERLRHFQLHQWLKMLWLTPVINCTDEYAVRYARSVTVEEIVLARITKLCADILAFFIKMAGETLARAVLANQVRGPHPATQKASCRNCGLFGQGKVTCHLNDSYHLLKKNNQNKHKNKMNPLMTNLNKCLFLGSPFVLM